MTAFTKVATTGDRVLDQRGSELQALLLHSDKAVLRAETVLTDVQSLTAARSNTRVNVEAALSDLATAAASLRGLANDVEHDPRLLLTGRRP